MKTNGAMTICMNVFNFPNNFFIGGFTKEKTENILLRCLRSQVIFGTLPEKRCLSDRFYTRDV